MCHAIIRVVCQVCGQQVGDALIKDIKPCSPPIRPKWGSGVSLLEQHQVKRFKKIIPACEVCKRDKSLPDMKNKHLDTQVDVKKADGD